MINQKLATRFFNTMHEVHKVTGVEGATGKQGVITPLQVDALLYLHKNKQTTVSTLGGCLQLSSSAITQLVSRLESSGFIIRENSPDDRRLIILAITNKGKKIFTKMHSSRINRLKTIVSLVPEKDITELIRIFSNLLEKVKVDMKVNTKN